MVTKKLVRATDDGYQHPLIPGVKATAEAERLAAALAVANARLDYPGPLPELVDAEDPLTLALTLVGANERTLDAFTRWTPPIGDAGFTPQRRFARWFDRLALPDFGRTARFEFLVALNAAGVRELEADGLHVAMAHDDKTVLAAKRAFVSGDAMLLERRAADFAAAVGVPIAALDRGLALWDSTDPLEAPEHDAIRAALRVG